MMFILWPAFSDAASDFLHRGVAATVAAENGNVDNGFTSCILFLFYFSAGFFNRVFVAALWSDRGQRSRSCLPVGNLLLGETFGQQKRPRVRPLRCFRNFVG